MSVVPLEILNNSKNKKIEVHTSDKNVYTGTLIDFDIYVNMVLSNTEFIEFDTNKKHNISNAIIQGHIITYVEILN